jgi:hypothetical protein
LFGFLSFITAVLPISCLKFAAYNNRQKIGGVQRIFIGLSLLPDIEQKPFVATQVKQ